MNKELRNGLEIAVNYYDIREQALLEVAAKSKHYEKKEKYYENVLRSANGNGKTVLGIILMCCSVLLCLISLFATISTVGTSIESYEIAAIIVGTAPFLIGAVVMLIIGFRLVTSRKKRKTQVEERAQKIWDDEVVPAKRAFDEQLELSTSIIEPLDEMYREFVEEIIPPSYRCYSDAFAIYDLVANGRADTMKEAINLYEVILREERKRQEFEYAMSRYESATREMILNQTITNIQLSQIRDDIRRRG